MQYSLVEVRASEESGIFCTLRVVVVRQTVFVRVVRRLMVRFMILVIVFVLSLAQHGYAPPPVLVLPVAIFARNGQVTHKWRA